jgi:methylmalonyl-CoA mutase cobalamin-binding domain/chain
MGGMTKAVDSGWAKLKIEASAAEKQARIDSGQDVIVGVNKYKLAKEDAIETLEVDNHAVRENQVKRLQSVRAKRNAAQVKAALDALTACAETGQGNLLDLSIQAVRLRATVGEVSDALEKAWGRHRADTQKVTGVYAAAYDSAEGWDQLKAEIAEFAESQGRRPRVMIAKLGQDGHDRGAKVVATAFADLGFDVDMGPLFQTAEECARQAIENDVHAVGVSTLAAGHKTLVPAIIQSLKAQGADDIIVFVGGVIPRQDYDFLYESGVKGIYGPGTPIRSGRCWSNPEGGRAWPSAGRGLAARRPPRAGQNHHAGLESTRCHRREADALPMLMPHRPVLRISAFPVSRRRQTPSSETLGLTCRQGHQLACSPSIPHRHCPAARSSATRRAWSGSPRNRMRSSGRVRPAARSAASPRRRANRYWCARRPVTTWSSSRPSAWARARPRWPA